jgi:glyoxylate reductase
MRIYVTQPLPEPSLGDLLDGATIEVGDSGIGEDQLIRRVSEVDAILSTPPVPITARVLSAALRVRIVANCAVGTDNIDLAACRDRGVVVTNTPGVLTEATADLAFALILAVTRRLHEGEALVRSGTWTGWKPLELLGVSLEGKVLGIYGAGRIGSAVARRAVAFGMTVFTVVAEDGPERFEELLRCSDVLTIHVPLTPETRGRFGDAELGRMKPGSFLVNTARGPIVDEAALVGALESGRLRGAGLDVFQHEPKVHPGLLSRPDVVLLPHLGSATEEVRLSMARMACEEIARLFRGEPAKNRVA